MYAGGAQKEASQYMNVLRAEDSEARLSRDNFQPLLNMFENFSAAPWLDVATKQAYRQAWKNEDALSSMLNWYRASPMVVPQSGTPGNDLLITSEMLEKYHISMPHLLLWGLDDVALLPEARADLDGFCADLTVKENKTASHWILHEKPEWVANKIREFLAAK